MTRTAKKKEEAAAATEAGEPAGITGSLVLTPQQINGLPVYSQQEAVGTYSGQFAYFYPHDGSAPSVLLLGEDSYLNVTEQQEKQQQQQFV